MRNISEPNPDKQIRRNVFGIKTARQKPGAFKWWVPGCSSVADAAAGCTGDEPALVNSWEQPSDPLERFGFRLHADGSLEFKGHLNAANAVSGTVAVTLPGANAGDVDFLLANDQYFHTVITTDDGTSFQIAMVFIEAATGDVTITWPAA